MKLKQWKLAAIGLWLATSFLTGCSGAGSKGPVDVKVTLTEFKIESSTTAFKVGVPYHFSITNNGAIAHEFMIAPVVQSGSSGSAQTPVPLAQVDGGQLQPGQTATLDYTFTAPATAGTLELACHLPGHYESGMHIPITVTQ
jgi:uncharacterized cupredoxin-like copper-binding protein